MDDYISREEAKRFFNQNFGSVSHAVIASRLLDEIPAADVVPVVRCRDCKHCDPENHHCDHHMGTAAPLRRNPDDFCSYGERKDGADNG